MLPYSLCKCLHPIKFVPPNSKTGEPIITGCRTCSNCLHAMRSIMCQRMDNEAKLSASVTFITLTYDNDHLPIYCLDTSCSSGTYNIINREVPKDQTDVRPIQYLAIQDNENAFPSIPITNLYIDTPHFASVCKRDVQLFLKRLRKYLSSDPLGLLTHVPQNLREIRYLVASEYGPTTFRPHYHGLLYAQHVDVSTAIEHAYLHKAWKLCDSVNCQAERVATSASSYVSKYLYKQTDLPTCLQVKNATKTFHLCSRRPVFGGVLADASTLYTSVENNHPLIDKVILKPRGGLETITVPFASSVQRFHFPPTLPNLDHSDIQRYYTTLRGLFYRYNRIMSKFNSSDYGIFYTQVSKLIPNYIKQVDTYLCDECESVFSPNYNPSVYGYKITESMIRDRLSHNEFFFGIPHNRRFFIRALYQIYSNDLSCEDYIYYHDRFYRFKHNESLRLVATFWNQENHNLFDKLMLTYPLELLKLPLFCEYDYYLKHHAYAYDSFGITYSDLYDQHGCLIFCNLTDSDQSSIINAHLSTDTFKQYSKMVSDKARDFKNKRMQNDLCYNKL